MMRHVPTVLMLLCVGIIAILAALLATVLSFAVLGSISDSLTANYVWFYYAAALASLIIGPLLWCLSFLHQEQVSQARAIGVSMLTSLIAHPFTWLFALLLARLNSNTGFIWMSMNEVTAYNPVVFILVFSFESILYLGWITTIVGGLFGALLGYIFKGHVTH